MNPKNFPTKLDSKTSCLRITVPENLDLALEGLIRKVLKEQPKTDNIYSFAANYFETLLKIRDKAGAKFTADQLCPFHNDEDAHEMIKLAGTFTKRGTERFKKKNEESLLSKTENVARNKHFDSQIQNKKNFKKSKLKKESKGEKTAEQNKQATNRVMKKLPLTVKNVPEEEKKQTKLLNKRSDDINLENTQKKESDDEEFLASDPIKELVEKELMETNLSGKKEQIIENTATNINAPMPSEGLITSKATQEEQKPADNINVHPNINDLNEPLKEEITTGKENLIEKDKESNKNEKIEETKAAKEREVKIENNEITEQLNEKNTSDAKEEEKDKTAVAEAQNKRSEDVKEEITENGKNEDKLNRESFNGTPETDKKSATNLSVSKEETENVEITNTNAENVEEKIIIDKTPDNEGTKPEAQTLTQEIQSEQKTKRPLNEKKEPTDVSSEILTDETERDTNKAISNEIFQKESPAHIDQNAKEQEEKNITNTEEITVPNEIKPEEKELEELSNGQQTPRVSSKVDRERESQLQVEIAAKHDSPESLIENKTVETLVINTTTEPDTKMQEDKITNNEALPTAKVEATEVKSQEGNEPMREIPKKIEEINDEESTTRTEEQPNVTTQTKESPADKTETETEIKTENKQYILKSNEKSLETEETTEDNKDKNAIQRAEKNGVEALENKTTEEGVKPPGQVINTNENNDDTKTESESTMSQKDSKDNSSEGESGDLSSADKKSYQRKDKKPGTSSQKLPLDPINPNEVTEPEKAKKLINSSRVETIEDTLFGEKTQELAQSISNESPQIPEEQAQKMKISEIQEDQQGVNQNTEKSELTNKEIAVQEEENTRKLEDEESASLDLLSTTRSDKEKLNEVITSGLPDIDETPSKNNKTESEKESRKEECNNQKPYAKGEDESVSINEDETKREKLCAEADTHQILKEGETSNEKPKLIRMFKTNSENEEDHSKVEEELCAVVDVEQISKYSIDGNKLEEKHQPEAETIQNNEDKTIVGEQTIEEKSLHVITIEDTEKTNEHQEMPQSSGERQIKTIQSHYYNTLQVPERVTKEYRVHNISPPSAGTLLTVASQLQQSYEPKYESLNQEEQNEKMVDLNMNSPVLMEKILSPTELTEADTPTENINFDKVESVDHQNISKAASPPADEPNQNELELDTPKTNSDDLLDIMTPTSSYSLNLSELSWQTVNELFLDSEKRNSSLEKEAIRYATPKTSKSMAESTEQKATESRQEIEEIFYKAVASSGGEAVPMPPRDPEVEAKTSENVEEEKKEDKAEGESIESSSDSSNEQISVNDDTPFISVEVKTVIETQILNDDDDENDESRNQEQNEEEKRQPDMEIKIEATVDLGTTQSESESKEDKTETTVGTRRDGLKASQEIQPKNGHYKLKESSSAEQTAGEGSSGESESTTSSAATKIRRANFAKRNFSSTQSLLSTQSLDMEKKNALVKTRSLSTFRHGVTDFEVWNKIEKELEEAATKIQSKYRGYKTRKKLQRENAMQITTEESSVSETSVEAEVQNECQQSTGEFHDSIVLSEHPR